jgi:hypothetical protein
MRCQQRVVRIDGALTWLWIDMHEYPRDENEQGDERKGGPAIIIPQPRAMEVQAVDGRRNSDKTAYRDSDCGRE